MNERFVLYGKLSELYCKDREELYKEIYGADLPEYKKAGISLGKSDIASLVLRSKNKVEILKLGENGVYIAWIIQDIKAPENYKMLTEFKDFLWIYDDLERVARIVSQTIEVYRSGPRDVLIRLLRR